MAIKPDRMYVEELKDVFRKLGVADMPKSYENVLRNMIDHYSKDMTVKDANSGSVLLTMLEALDGDK